MMPAFLVLGSALHAQQTYDLVLHEATAAGMATAKSGARQGLKMALLEPGQSSKVVPLEPAYPGA